MWLHRRQPTRLPHPWDSPGKNTAAGCHFLLHGMTVKNESEVVQSCPTCSDPMDCSLPGSSVHGIFQAREWVAIAFSRERSWRHFKILSYIWTVKFHKATNKNKLDLDWLTQKYFHNVLSTEKKASVYQPQIFLHVLWNVPWGREHREGPEGLLHTWFIPVREGRWQSQKMSHRQENNKNSM